MSQFFVPSTQRNFRAFQTQLSQANPLATPPDPGGQGTVIVGPFNTAVQWEVYQMTVFTTTNPQQNNQYWPSASVFHNSFLLAWTVNGWKDTLADLPSTYLLPGDTLLVQWDGGVPSSASHIENAYASVWYNEAFR